MSEYIFEPEASTKENVEAARTQILSHGTKPDSIHPTGDLSFYEDIMPAWGPMSIVVAHVLAFTASAFLIDVNLIFLVLIPLLIGSLIFSIINDVALYAQVSSKCSAAYEKMKAMIELPSACSEALFILRRVNESLSKLNAPVEANIAASNAWAQGQELALEIARLTKEADDPAWVLRQEASQQLVLLAAQMLVVEKLAQDRAHAHLLIEPVAELPEQELLALTAHMTDENDIVSKILAGEEVEKQAIGDLQ